MGREIKRVPLDFDWSQGEVWQGYLMPDRLNGSRCTACENGSTYAAAWLHKVAYVIAGLANDATDEARGRSMHPYLQPLRQISYGGMHNADDPRPGPEFAEFLNGLGVEEGFMGRDTYAVLRALINAAGFPDSWGTCGVCQGHATTEDYPGQRDEADSWEPTEPPVGDGWQMWETTSEGSPMSPVFGSAEELATWLSTTGASMFGSATASYAQWLAIIEADDFAHVQIAPGVIVM